MENNLFAMCLCVCWCGVDGPFSKIISLKVHPDASFVFQFFTLTASASGGCKLKPLPVEVSSMVYIFTWSCTWSFRNTLWTWLTRCKFYSASFFYSQMQMCCTYTFSQGWKAILLNAFNSKTLNIRYCSQLQDRVKCKAKSHKWKGGKNTTKNQSILFCSKVYILCNTRKVRKRESLFQCQMLFEFFSCFNFLQNWYFDILSYGLVWSGMKS